MVLKKEQLLLPSTLKFYTKRVRLSYYSYALLASPKQKGSEKDSSEVLLLSKETHHFSRSFYFKKQTNKFFFKKMFQTNKQIFFPKIK
jgi:hypothetical protein